MTLCERALQPLWGASMADGFSAFQAAARGGARKNTILALQPLTASLFAAALVDLRAKTASKVRCSALIGDNSQYQSSLRISIGKDTAEACNGTALSQILLQTFHANPKLLLDPTAVGTVTTTVAPAHIGASPSLMPFKPREASLPRVPPLNLSRIPNRMPAEVTNASTSFSTIPASALTARSEWLRRGHPSLANKPTFPAKAVFSQANQEGNSLQYAFSECEAVSEVLQQMHEKQQRLQQPLANTVAVQYRSLSCPSPDLGFRVVFNGSNNFNRYAPFDTVRIVSARSSRTILDRAVAPLSERQMPPRRPHHGQYITYREDFFDDDGSRAATRSSARSRVTDRTAKTAASRNLKTKLDALESIALKALAVQPALILLVPDATARPTATSRSLLKEFAPASVAQVFPMSPKMAATAASPRARRFGLSKAQNEATVQGLSVRVRASVEEKPAQ
jgi:hypothetical protein